MKKETKELLVRATLDRLKIYSNCPLCKPFPSTFSSQGPYLIYRTNTGCIVAPCEAHIKDYLAGGWIKYDKYE